jgi:hypothetical protein
MTRGRRVAIRPRRSLIDPRLLGRRAVAVDEDTGFAFVHGIKQIIKTL